MWSFHMGVDFGNSEKLYFNRMIYASDSFDKNLKSSIILWKEFDVLGFISGEKSMKCMTIVKKVAIRKAYPGFYQSYISDTSDTYI